MRSKAGKEWEMNVNLKRELDLKEDGWEDVVGEADEDEFVIVQSWN